MKRIIIDFNKLTDELKVLFTEIYPEGYSVNDVISFQNGKGETVEAIELKTGEAVYLVKVKKPVTKETESETDEAIDFILNGKQEDQIIPLNSEDSEDVEELEDEFEDESDSFFDLVD